MSEMNDIIKNGQLMPADLTAQIRDKYYHVDVDPFTKSKRLFFDNSGGSFRLKDASEAFRNVDDLPNCGGHGGAASDYLDSLRVQACKDISTMFNAEGGCIATSMTASIIVFDVSEAIIANVPGTNVVTTELEHPSAFDGCAVPAEKYGKELRVAKTNPRTGTIDPMDVVKLVDKDTCLLSVIMTSNITGAVLDIETIAREARKIKPDLFIICDSVQHTPHGLTDMKAWGLDCVNFAPYKFGGARGLGVGWLSDRVMNLPHRKLIREKQSNWEMGGCAPGMYAMLSAIFNYVCWIGEHFTDSQDRRTLYVEGMNRIMLHERALLYRLLHGSDEVKGLLDIEGVNVAVEMPDLTQRDLIVPIVFDKLTCEQASRAYEKAGVVVHERTDASLYSARQVNSINQHGIVRISPLHCHTYEDIDEFLKITAEIAK
ncbi:aminotransferase class V-fold PLP-dependent enzyme [uncultured Gemmiger sp.]|uniref:aminotransferase class V-fold PLP-dependent enzyme n=1 Tax=uncultured Gemmiger sp. TaxID=1623490 RepID=UPI0025D1F1BE|nr:aminotransferase class V-fold PLP-dependent enzyme [uncultured Gemmiger sp.]